ncbi:hypothetical protein MHI18_13395 [Peribacillus sp. FSL H8-0477]|uniref:hypothetical protein n=1 Tax=Peribacillus sp. FSL H8-0477 TaxID=2921388 RepID=UPI0030F5F061
MSIYKITVSLLKVMIASVSRKTSMKYVQIQKEVRNETIPNLFCLQTGCTFKKGTASLFIV